MISKPLPAHSFYYTCRYVLSKTEAEVLAVEGVRGHDFKLMAADFEEQRLTRPTKEVACFHAVLSFHPSESPADSTMQELAEEYLKRLEIVNTQFVVVKHTDKYHLHMHVVANMVDNDGEAISDSWIGLRGKKVAQQLTQEFNLFPAKGKNIKLIHLEALSDYEAAKYKIYLAVSEQLPHVRSVDELARLLQQQGIETLYKYKRQTEERQGISFKMGDYSFKGSQIDRKFSLGNLEKTLALQQKQSPQQQVQQVKPELNSRSAGQTQAYNATDSTPDLAKEIGSTVVKTIEILLKPEETNNNIPYELTQEGYEQKKKKQARDRDQGLHR